MLTPFLDSLSYLSQPSSIGWVLLGTFLGMIFGAIPGLGGGMLMALMLPITFTMFHLDAQIFLISIYVGGVSGALVSAVLLGIPGAPSAVMTALDGYEMCKQGRAAEALSLGIMGSFVGGMISWVVLVALSIPLAFVASKFRNFDYFAFVMLGLILIAFTGGGNPIKSLMSGLLGIFVSMVGFDSVSASSRFTFGFHSVASGFSILPVLIGVFALRQMLSDIGSTHTGKPQQHAAITDIVRHLFRVFRYPLNIIRSSLIGSWIGILPGIGANIGAVISYSVAQTFSRNKEKFGHGSEEGVVASETGNNATVGGALVPLISLGIPGSGQDVILMAALILHQVEPGPLLALEHPTVFYGIISAYLFANIAMLILMVVSIPMLTRVISAPLYVLAPVVLMFCVVGVVATNNRIEDAWIMFAFGLFGFLMSYLRFPLSPFVIGFVLGPLAEERIRAALMSSNGDFTPLFTRPVSGTAIAACVAFALWPLGKALYQALRRARSKPAE
ncbi:tripartite tricarboxylate transporter permease [Devosia algicola]|uniref:Tripartite tricarboxylate transporter permease n=1 Tax=Devosia algicola TaxID=3026418 RepID=A0ABY7YQI6_9HYPH|nr:tripartite tricarboxylate transporter permease [Devosia algicola]WDR03551.1 tripartite tricarboxylate transporter permease [Devosia algicola]